MSICRECGAEIDWMRKQDGGYIPVNLEPVFVIEGEGQDKFYSEEEGELIGREARPGEIQTLEQKIDTPVAFVPHWRTCRKGKEKH